MKCMRGLEIQVLSSGAGYYIGTLTEEGFPNCRISEDYFPTAEAAQKAGEEGFAPRNYAVEIQFCHGGAGCLPK